MLISLLVGVDVFHITNDLNISSLVPLAPPEPATKGNPKCWTGGFDYDLCCTKNEMECWGYPFTREFCCEAVLPPRPPIIPGGQAGQPRTSRCRGDADLLACQLSLDEIGVLFETPGQISGGTDKASGWHDYLGLYERALLHMPLNSNVLEFGVLCGSSMALWSEYFPNGKVLGIDRDLGPFFGPHGLEALISHGAFSRGNVYVMEANTLDATVLDHIKRLGFEFDVMVDDASHNAQDQIARFEFFFPELRPGGVYIIEDIHSWPFLDSDVALSYFAKLSASVYIKQEPLMGSHQIRQLRQGSNDWRHQIESVNFMRDVVIVVKAADARA